MGHFRFHPAQIINYLKLSKLPVGYLINFNSKSVVYRRFINLRE
ncbi:MAG: GxxExxY protein [Spirochaetales bacterium]|nr:GxxExxY protein [Spirochaetales bacterium]